MVMVIAEAGVNHNGDVRLAHRLVDAAKSAGANAVKFQMFVPERLDPPGERREMLKGLVLRPTDLASLKMHAASKDIEFICTPFDEDSLGFLIDLGVNYVKISSGDWNNWPLVSAAKKAKKRLIMSTGMTKISDCYTYNPDDYQPYAVLHCVSAYPAPIEDVNLKAMMALTKYYVSVGLSDHTRSLVIPAAAVAMGADVIEKHLTLDCRMEGPDHRASLEPRDFSEMVANIREVETALGDGVKRPMPSEAATMQIRDEREAFRCAS